MKQRDPKLWLVVAILFGLVGIVCGMIADDLPTVVMATGATCVAVFLLVAT